MSLALFSDCIVPFTTPLWKLYNAVSHQATHPSSTNPSYVDGVKDAMKLLLDGIDYHPLVPDKERQASLANVLLSEFSEYQHDSTWFEAACHLCATITELSYKQHSYDVQVQIARFTWFILYLDDHCHKFPSSMEKFQRSMLSSERTDQLVLDKFRKTLVGMFDLWDFLPANCIVSSAMEYFNGCILEDLQAAHQMKISASAKSWPYYLRDKTGVAAAYAFMIFPRDSSCKVTDYIQVIADIMLYINLGNDVLSFYKEESANETGNYIHNRAHVDGKPAISTLSDVSRDIVAAYSRVCNVLQVHSPSSYELWRLFAHGYISFHVEVPRYRLRELGL